MLRRTLVLLSSSSPTPSTSKGRTIVRDPRKAASNQRNPKSPVAIIQNNQGSVPAQNEQHKQQLINSNKQPLPFEPSPQNQESIGSSLASYMLAGVGVAMGVTFVGAIFNAF